MSSATPTPESAVSNSLFDGYQPSSASYDELMDSTGAVRPHWQPFVNGWNTLGVEELDRRRTEAQRLLRENGITYTTHDDPAAARPWDVDLFPLVFAPEEWQRIVAGIVQRARLLDLVIRDAYAERRLISKRALPPELIFAHPGFMRPCHGQRVPTGCFLHLYAADLVRMPDGRWHVVADRTDAPLGLGYALENRIAFARMFPGMIRDCRVERLAPFFIALQKTLRELAPQHRDNPRIVLLSAGPRSFHYFEDAYLARYLNYTLAEAGDLTVRSDRVMLKTLGGLLPVDVVFRRLADSLCDPLELQGEASLGVPGLLQAVRAGNVAVVNAVGSSLVQSPAFLPHLPGLYQMLLREEPILASLETWWSGSTEVRQQIVSQANDLILHPAFTSDGVSGGAAKSAAVSPPADGVSVSDGTDALPFGYRDKTTDPGSTVSSEDVHAWLDRSPFSLVAHAPFERSAAPMWTSRAVHSAPVSLRVFAVRSGGTYQVMPGGLVRVVPGQRVLDPSISAGRASKDAWVVSKTEVPDVSLLRPSGQAMKLRRGGAELPSRVADNMFWLGRYVERADTTARLMRTLVVRLADESEAAAAPELLPLLKTLAGENALPAELAADGPSSRRTETERFLTALIWDECQPSSLAVTLKFLDHTANEVRDRLSLDGWKIVNRLYRGVRETPAAGRSILSDLLWILGRVISDLAAFGGMAAESMTRSQGWRFLELGRRLERSLHTISLVQNFLAEQGWERTSMQETLLEVGDSLMTYRSRYLANLRQALVLDILLTDETNPRSLAFQLAAIEDHVAHLPRDESQALLGDEQRLAMNVLNSVRQVDLAMLEETRSQNERTRLDKLLARLTEQLPRLSDLVTHKFFVHAGIPRQLAERRSDTRQ